MTVEEIRSFLDYIANKEQTGNTMSPDEYNAALKSGIRDLVAMYYGIVQQYKPGSPTPAIAWEVTQKVTDTLDVLKVIDEYSVALTGKLTRPTDYMHHSSFMSLYDSCGDCGTGEIVDVNLTLNTVSVEGDHRSQYTEGTKARIKGSIGNDGNYIVSSDAAWDGTNTVLTLVEAIPTYSIGGTICPGEFVGIREVKDEMLSYYLENPNRRPTLKYPVAVFYNNFIQFYPTNIRSVVWTYLRYPTVPVWGYTMSAGEAVYDATASVQVELPDSCHMDLVRLILSYRGINLREEQLIQYAEMAKAKGN